MEPAFDDRDVTAMLNAFFDTKVRLAQIGDDVRTIRLILEDGDEGEEEEAEEDRPLTPEQRARSERTNKLLLERIAYHEARIAARERGDDPDAATA